MLHKIRHGKVPEIIKDYCECNEEGTRRWHQIRTENSSHRMIKKLPKFQQTNVWNKTIDDKNRELTEIPKTETFGKKLKQHLMLKYQTSCNKTGCYSCNQEKIRLEEIERSKEEEREIEREKMRREYQQQQKEWQDYFGMSSSQAEEYEQKRTREINQQYEELMKSRSKKPTSDQSVDGTNGTD